MEDAGKAVEAGGRAAREAKEEASSSKPVDYDGERRQHNDNRQKRKGDWNSDRQQHGSRGRNDGKRHKKGDMGRAEYFRDGPDKRAKTNESREKRIKDGTNASTYGVQYSKEEISAEERRPKRKVAVMIGYSGTGYKGMQITPTEKTIEGDLFNAFIKAGAISKANADDPKKAGLVRCARTDKGVHAAGNMISLKLIVEEEDIVEKINAELSPQIRVWGIERTIGSFSCYQACDSRWYEYLIPSHAFLPPHPSSWLAKKLEDMADEAGDREGYEGRQKEILGFWEKVDEEDIKPILETIDEDIRWEVVKALQGEDEADAKAAKADADVELPVKAGKNVKRALDEGEDDGDDEKTEEAAIIINEPAASRKPETSVQETAAGAEAEAANGSAATAPHEQTAATVEATVDTAISYPPKPSEAQSGDSRPPRPQLSSDDYERQTRLRAAARQLRQAYTTAKRRYRIPKERIDRIQAALSKFVGTNNYHNFTIQKTYRDPSAKRHIKSFVVNPKPILIGESADEADKSEWLSLKVHGQSFMMHQIRKMVGMVTLLVRCGSDLSTLTDSLGPDKYSIPKVPGLGLLLERPVFDSYNNLQAPKHNRESLLFSKYETALEEFKEREIYQRIFREEEERGEFGRFFNHIDNFKEGYFLYVTSKGLEAVRQAMSSSGGGEGKAAGEEEARGVGPEKTHPSRLQFINS